MVEEGIAFWQGSRPGQLKPVGKRVVEGRDLSDLVSEDRR